MTSGAITAGIASGGAVCLGALFGGPISDASMNPARSLGPAVVSGQLGALWLYLFAPALGALIAVAACRCGLLQSAGLNSTQALDATGGST